MPTNDSCVVCGAYIPEGYGHVCRQCERGATETKQEAETDRLRRLLSEERRAHVETRKRLEKAEHDRDRYAKRVHFLQGDD